MKKCEARAIPIWQDRHQEPELVIAFMVGLAGAVPGALIGSARRRMVGTR